MWEIGLPGYWGGCEPFLLMHVWGKQNECSVQEQYRMQVEKLVGSGQEWFWMLVFVSGQERGEWKGVNMGLEESWEGNWRTWAAVTSRREMSGWCMNDKGELAMQRSAVMNWGANRKWGQQQEAACSSPLLAFAHTVITWRRCVKVRGNREPPHVLSDLFTCLLVLVQHLLQHRREEEPRGGWGMRCLQLSSAHGYNFFLMYCEAQFKGDLENHRHLTSHTDINSKKKGGREHDNSLLFHCLYT